MKEIFISLGAALLVACSSADFLTLQDSESREAGVDYNEDENDEVNGSEAYTWMFRTVTYNNPNI